MTKYRLGLHARLCFYRPFATLPLPAPTSSSHVPINHKTLCFSLANKLIFHGFFHSAQKVILRIIKHSLSLSEAITAFQFSLSHGLQLDPTTLIRQLVTSGEPHKAEAIYCMFNEGGLEPNHSILISMVICYCNLGKLEDAFHVFDVLLCDRGVLPTVHVLQTLVLSLCNRGRVEEARLLSMDMESYGLVLDKVIYTTLINGYSKTQDMKTAMMLFLRMLKLGCEPDKYTYVTLINGFINLGMFYKGWVMHQQMVEFGLEPDPVSYYRTIISKYCKDHEVDRALVLAEVDKMLDNGFVPDHVMFFSLINNNPRVSEISLAYNFLRAIAESGCDIDLSSISRITLGKVTTNITLDINHLSNIMLHIKILLGEFVARNSPLTNVAFNISITALCSGGNLVAARLCRDEMTRVSLQPSLSAYNSMIKCLYQKGLVEEAKSLLEDMQDEGRVPDQATFLIMINELCKQGDIQSAFEVLDQMEESELKPSVAIYDSIIGYLGRKKRINKAVKIYWEMVEAGICPDKIMIATMINALSRNGRANQALKLFDNMLEDGVQPSHHAYTALISGLVKKNMIEKACVYLVQMMEEGFKPNTAFCTSLIKQFLEKRDVKFAWMLFDFMKRSDIELDLVTYITLTSGVSRNIISSLGREWLVPQRPEESKERLFGLLHNTMLPKKKCLEISVFSHEQIKSLALSLIDELKNSPLMPNLYLYNGIISGFCWTKRVKDAYKHLKMMQNEGLQPNQVTFTILIDGHLRNGEVDCAVDLFNIMNERDCRPDNIVYNTLIRGLCEHGRPIESISLFYTMVKKGLAPSKASYANLLSSLCANNWSSHALKICQDMLANEYVPCVHNLKLLICKLKEENKLREAHIVHTLLLYKKQRKL